MKAFSKIAMMGMAVALAMTITGNVTADSGDDSPFDREYGGMMHGDLDSSGMMGSGMMGGGNFGFPGGGRISMEEVEESLRVFMRFNRMTGIEIAEVMEFERNFYAQLHETESGIGAIEVLIDPYSGYVSAEPGPNMMWNTKFGHMRGWGGSFDQPMKVDEEEAVESAQDYLDHYDTNLTADDNTDEFYGYYTLHVLDKDKIVGMLSVNGFDGSVWYHSWHGEFVGMNGSDHN